MTIKEIRKNIEEETPRSAWGKGVKEYALELVDELIEREEHCGTELVPQGNTKLLRKELLNGADDWSQYSYGGCSLAYDCDIAERLCTPSELRKKKGGELNPSSSETWFDVQARALAQASGKIGKYFRA